MLDTKTPNALLFRLGRKPDSWSPPTDPAHFLTAPLAIASTIRRATIAFCMLPLGHLVHDCPRLGL